MAWHGIAKSFSDIFARDFGRRNSNLIDEIISLPYQAGCLIRLLDFIGCVKFKQPHPANRLQGVKLCVANEIGF